MVWIQSGKVIAVTLFDGSEATGESYALGRILCCFLRRFHLVVCEFRQILFLEIKQAIRRVYFSLMTAPVNLEAGRRYSKRHFPRIVLLTLEKGRIEYLVV